jgi:hypothetical protein
LIVGGNMTPSKEKTESVDEQKQFIERITLAFSGIIAFYTAVVEVIVMYTLSLPKEFYTLVPITFTAITGILYKLVTNSILNRLCDKCVLLIKQAKKVGVEFEYYKIRLNVLKENGLTDYKVMVRIRNYEEYPIKSCPAMFHADYGNLDNSELTIADHEGKIEHNWLVKINNFWMFHVIFRRPIRKGEEYEYWYVISNIKNLYPISLKRCDWVQRFPIPAQKFEIEITYHFDVKIKSAILYDITVGEEVVDADITVTRNHIRVNLNNTGTGKIYRLVWTIE